MRKKGHPVKWIQQYSLDSVRKNYLVVLTLHFKATIIGKSVGTLLHSWGIFQFTQAQPLPSPHKQCWKRVSGIFVRFLTLYRVWGREGGRTARKFRKGWAVLRGNEEMTQKYKYCSTVPRTSVQDCLNSGFIWKVCFFLFFLGLIRIFVKKGRWSHAMRGRRGFLLEVQHHAEL